MGAGRKTQSFTLEEKSKPPQTANCSATARNLRKSDLGAVIFGCTHKTITECTIKQLFGLPVKHFSYVKNVTPGLTLFLFNYSDRKLYGIFEAASPGQLNINPYGWSEDEKDGTPYPAQVRIRVRKQCRALQEKEFSPVIADNYYLPTFFWFELDHNQTSKLIDLFLSSPSSHLAPPLPNAAMWNKYLNGTSGSSCNGESTGAKDGKSEDISGNQHKVDETVDTWASLQNEANHLYERSYASALQSNQPEVDKTVDAWASPQNETNHLYEGSYACALAQSNTSLPQKTWSSLFKSSAASDSTKEDVELKKMLNSQVSASLSVLDQSNMDWESTTAASFPERDGQHFEPWTDQWDAEDYEGPAKHGKHCEAPQDMSGAEGYEEPAKQGEHYEGSGEICDWEELVEPVDWSGTDSSRAAMETNFLPLIPSLEPLQIMDPRDEDGFSKSVASDLHHQSHELTTEWDAGIHDDGLTNPLRVVGEYLKETETSVALAVGGFRSSDIQPLIAKLIRELGEMKGLQLNQNQIIIHLERELVQSKLEMQHMRNQYNLLNSRQTSSSNIQFEGTDVESFGLPKSDDSILIVGGYDGSSWVSDLSSYSPSSDLIKSLTPMTSIRSYTSAAKLNGELYLFGGVADDVWYDTVESYNPRSNEWSIRPPLNQKKGSLAGICVSENLFAIGGGNRGECFAEVETFDMNVGRWVYTQSMQQKRSAPAVADINGTLYVVGGFDGEDYLKSVERFDPREHKWTGMANMNSRRGCHSLVAMHEKLYALGGYDGKKMVSTVEVFDPRACSWMKGESMKAARGSSGAVVMGEKIYIIGGVKDNHEILDSVECYKEGYGWQFTNLKGVGKRCFFFALVL